MRIEWQIKVEDPRFLELKLNGAVWREVHKASFARKLSSLKACATQEALREAFFKLECSVSQLSALRLLAKRDYFTAEMRKRLKDKKLSQRAVDHALEKCHALGYLDDERLTSLYASSLKRKGKGPRYIAQKLKERLGYLPNIPRDPEEEREAIVQLLKRRFSHLSRDGEKEKAKAVRFLLGRGFELGEIVQEVKKLDKR